MKSLFNNIFLHLASLAIIYSQIASPTRFSLKSATDGEVSYFDDGFASNVVAEIRLMGDSLHGLVLAEGCQCMMETLHLLTSQPLIQ